MRKLFWAAVLVGACGGLFAQGPSTLSPQATQLEPKVAKPGTILTITGVALDKSRVEEVYLTDHRFDTKVKVLEQTDKSLKIRVPPFVKAGRQQLLFLTASPAQAFLEQPLYVLVEIDEDARPSAQAVPPKSGVAPAQVSDRAVGNSQPDKQD